MTKSLLQSSLKPNPSWRFGVRAALFLVLAFSTSCTRPKLQTRSEALRLSWAPRSMVTADCDDMNLKGLEESVATQLRWLRAASPATTFTFGPETYRRDEYLVGLEYIGQLLTSETRGEAFCRAIEENFQFFEVYGGDRWGEILLTSYYEPEIPAARKSSGMFPQPIYSVPKDLVEVATSSFSEAAQASLPMRGRIQVENQRTRLIPYFTREEIDRGGQLSKRKLELAWGDPIDVFFMQIQGSGTLVFGENDRMRVGYADQNGHPYTPIGRYLKQWIPLDQMTLHSIEKYLRSIPLGQAESVLYKNPSYVFFRELDGAPATSLGVPVTAGRTLAVDGRYFPKGALTFLEFQKPVFASEGDLEPTHYLEVSRFGFDQDSGGAIRGGGRADLFWGSGPDAKRNAGVVKHAAKLFYLAPKREFLEARRNAAPSNSETP